jgi:hypothetical protein
LLTFGTEEVVQRRETGSVPSSPGFKRKAGPLHSSFFNPHTRGNRISNWQASARLAAKIPHVHASSTAQVTAASPPCPSLWCPSRCELPAWRAPLVAMCLRNPNHHKIVGEEAFDKNRSISCSRRFPITYLAIECVGTEYTWTVILSSCCMPPPASAPSAQATGVHSGRQRPRCGQRRCTLHARWKGAHWELRCLTLD